MRPRENIPVRARSISVHLTTTDDSRASISEPAQADSGSTDALVTLTGSRSRAAILGLLYGDDSRPRHQTQIAELTSLSRGAVRHELERLVEAGLVIRGKAWGHTNKRTERVESYGRPYSAARATPLYFDIRALVAKTRGSAARIRDALTQHVRLAWVTGTYAVFQAGHRDPISVVVIGEPRGLIEKRLVALSVSLGRPVRPLVIHREEWVARVDKRELLVVRLRRGPKLWLRGDGFALHRMERDYRETKALIRSALETGLDTTDEWDEDWDPFAPKPY